MMVHKEKEVGEIEERQETRCGGGGKRYEVEKKKIIKIKNENEYFNSRDK